MEKPAYVTAFIRPKNTEIKNIGNNWYLYERTSKYDPVKKRSRKISGKLLGKITEKGLQKTEKRLTKVASAVSKVILSDTVDVGSALYFYRHTEEIRERLKKYFPDLWKKIYVVSLLRTIYGPRFKRLQLHFEGNFISHVYPDLNFYPDDNRDLLIELGKRRSAISSFMKEDVNAHEAFILFDGHRLITSSRNMPFAELGYDSKRRFMPQINLIYIYSLGESTGSPVYYKQYIGSTPDVVAFSDIVKECRVEKNNITVIADKGFASESDFSLLDDNDLKYVIPLKRGNQYVKNKIPASPKDYQEGFTYHDRAISSTCFKEEGFNIFLYFDSKLYSEEAADASIRNDKSNSSKEKSIEAENKRRAKGKGRLTDEDLKKLQPVKMADIYRDHPEMGTITIKTNRTDMNSAQIYHMYKQRQAIEQFFKTYDDSMEFESSYMRNQTSEEAWLFLNHISAMIGIKCIMNVALLNESKNISFRDIIDTLRKITASKINDEWQIAPMKKATRSLIEKLGFQVTTEDMAKLLAPQEAPSR